MSDELKKKVDPTIHESAVRLGRIGGRAGGPARSKSLSAAERSAISREGGLAKAAKSKGLKAKIKSSKKKRKPKQ